MKCDVCNGQGEMFIIQGNPDYAIPETLTCEKCKGTGQLEVGNVAQPDACPQLCDVPAGKNRYGVDMGYFSKELKSLCKSLPDRTPEELHRYLLRLAKVAETV